MAASGDMKAEDVPSAVPRIVPKRRGVLCSRHAWYALLAWTICAGLYFYTANGIQGHDNDDEHAWRHYENLVDGFLSGHLYVSRAPDPRMLALTDPYDPNANTKYRMWDASLFHGHYYLYFGPTPAVLLMLPWKVVTGVHLPQRLATGIFACAGLAALTLLLTAVQRKHFPDATPIRLFWAVVAVAHANWAPVLLRRSAVWELPTITAAALLWWALYFLWRYQDGDRKDRWAIAAGVALAFALGARPTYVFGAACVVAMFAWPFSPALSVRDYVRRVLPAALPLAIGVAGLLTYNFQRFGSIFEFGQHYQLWGADERNVAHFSLHNAPFNAWLYLFSIPQFSPYFPFVRGVSLADLPNGYIDIEEMYGVCFAIPVVLLGFAAWRKVLKNRSDQGRNGALGAVLAAATATALLGATILCCFAGACSRYIVEFVAGWSIVTGIGFLAFFETGHAKPFTRAVAVVVVAWSIACVWLASFGFRDFAKTSQPKLYAAIAHTLDYPSAWFADLRGHNFGPVALEVRLSPTETRGTTVLVADGRPNEVLQLQLQRTDAHHIVLRLLTNRLIMVETPELTVPDAFTVKCEAPWLYPPAEHPYWDRYGKSPDGEARRLLFSITVNHVVYRRFGVWTFDPSRLDPVIQTAAAEHECAWVTQWQRIDSIRTTESSLANPTATPSAPTDVTAH